LLNINSGLLPVDYTLKKALVVLPLLIIRIDTVFF